MSVGGEKTKLKVLNLWPSRSVITKHMPKEYKEQFPNTRVVIDGTEIPIQKQTGPAE